jgi:protein TonB
VTIRHLPQPGDVVATRAQNQDDAALHGVVLVARRDEPPQSEATDLSNVIPFARPRRAAAAPAFPLPSIAAHERPQIAKIAIGASIAFFAISLALHGGMLAMFWHQPRQMPSVGVEAITVEIVVGATRAAGTALMPDEQEAVPAPPSEKPAEESTAAAALRATTVMAPEVPVAEQETAPEAQPQTIPEVQTAEPQPQEQPIQTTTTEIPESTEPTERTQAPRPQVQALQKAPERKRIDAPKDKKASPKNQVATAAPRNSANDIGRGHSKLEEDQYKGRVSAHLMRHQQYPAGARGEGRVGVSFTIDGSGRVTSAQLMGTSGNAAFDREVVAMARRASPFPPPPQGKARNFTVSVTFRDPRR